MYRPGAFAVDGIPALHAVIRERVFATLALAHEGGVQFAYAPIVLDAGEGLGTIRFHLAKANPVAGMVDGARLSVSFMGPDAYVSPDWYETQGSVPTWNYVAVEGSGIAHKLDSVAIEKLLADLSAQEEAKLLPKAPWTLDKLSKTRRNALLNAIEGFALSFETLEGKFKLSQDKKNTNFVGVIAGLKASGKMTSLAVAAAMQKCQR